MHNENLTSYLSTHSKILFFLKEVIQKLYQVILAEFPTSVYLQQPSWHSTCRPAMTKVCGSQVLVLVPSWNLGVEATTPRARS
jgi:hypothetical protein